MQKTACGAIYWQDSPLSSLAFSCSWICICLSIIFMRQYCSPTTLCFFSWGTFCFNCILMSGYVGLNKQSLLCSTVCKNTLKAEYWKLSILKGVCLLWNIDYLLNRVWTPWVYMPPTLENGASHINEYNWLLKYMTGGRLEVDLEKL